MVNNPHNSREDDFDASDDATRIIPSTNEDYEFREEYRDSDFYDTPRSEDETVTMEEYRNDDDYDREYDYTFDTTFDKGKAQFAYVNLPSGHKYGDWVAKSDYEILYEGFVDLGVFGQDVQSALIKRLHYVSNVLQASNTQNHELEQEMSALRNQNSASELSNRSKQQELEDKERALESEETKHKALVYGSIAAAVLGIILAIIFSIMWMGAKNDSASESQRSGIHQTKITELEGELKDSQSKVNELSTENKDLKDKSSSSDQRAKNAEKAAKDAKKDAQSKDDTIAQLQEDVKSLKEEPVTSTVTETAPPRENTVTSTVTQTAPSSPSSSTTNDE